MSSTITTAPIPRIESVRIDVTVRRRALRCLPLILILSAQAVLSTLLIHIGHDSGDEARYTYAGIQLWHELLHGGGSPYFETYFSGAPDLYSPMAAVAFWIGGIVTVRLMSVSFMLAATSFLFLSTRRLYGYAPALCAAGIFAGLGVTHEISGYGDYDSLALMCMSFAFYCAVRSQENQWFLLVPPALLLADFAKYVMLAFDPIVIAVSSLLLLDQGWRRVVKRCGVLSATTLSLLILGLLLAGGAYKQGIFFTTVARPPGTQAIFETTAEPASVVLHDTATWIGLVLVGAVIAVIAAAFTRSGRRALPILAVLLLAGLLVTIEGVHLHTDESMKRHDDFAAWFATIPAGWVLGYASVKFHWRLLKGAAYIGCVGVIGVLGIHYYPQGAALYPSRDSVLQQEAFQQLKPLLAGAGTHEVLLGGESDDSMLITDRALLPWWQHFDDVYIKYPIPERGGDTHGIARGRTCSRVVSGCMYLEGAAGYRAAIRAHWFALVTMIGDHPGLGTDTAIEQAVESTPGYVLVNTQDNGQFKNNAGAPTWIYLPDYRH